jgi:hypothetical protein
MKQKQNVVRPYTENFGNYNLEEAKSNYMNPNNASQPLIENSVLNETRVLLEDEYQITGQNGISNNGAEQIWWNYPIFEVGSYSQITNNMRYPNNPDEGKCAPASMCNTLYQKKKGKSNYIKPLQPVNNSCGTRVGYFTTQPNLLPFKTNKENILY